MCCLAQRTNGLIGDRMKMGLLSVISEGKEIMYDMC